MDLHGQASHFTGRRAATPTDHDRASLISPDFHDGISDDPRRLSMINPEARNDLVITERPGGADTGVLVYDPKTDTGHVLDGTAALVLAACDGTRDLADLADHVEARSESFSDKLSVDVALQQLNDAGLLVAPLPTSSGLSRRKMLRTMAIGAAGIAALPLIESISNARQAGAQPEPIAIDPKSASTTPGDAVAVTLSAQNVTSPADLVFWPVTQPSNGTVTIVGAVATYTPNAGFVGTDTFPYTGGECVAAPGSTPYPPPSLICPIGEFVLTGATPALVTIVVAAAPETTTTSTTAGAQPTAPSFAG
jgi:hypothetical protein